MKVHFLGILLFLIPFAVGAKPGEPYVLTGKEKSIFGIFQADLKKYPALYEGVDVNGYYAEFKAVNKLGKRKLKLGESLEFPDTPISKKLREEAAAKAATEAAAKKRAEVARLQPQAEHPGEAEAPAETIVIDEETRKKSARNKAVYQFEHAYISRWVHMSGDGFMAALSEGNLEPLIQKAREMVDDSFADALKLHAFREQRIYVIEFEPPQKASACYFIAIQEETRGEKALYMLEKGINLFGAGNPSVFCEREMDGTHANFGGREYTDLDSFLRELEAGSF